MTAKRYTFPGLTPFVDAAAKANGKPHARNRIDSIRCLKDCVDLAGQASYRAAQLGPGDPGTAGILAVVDERVNDLAIAHAAAVALRDHLKAGVAPEPPRPPEPPEPPKKPAPAK